jgi:hypothetical protein
VEAVSARADRVVARLQQARGRVILFGHGPFFRNAGHSGKFSSGGAIMDHVREIWGAEACPVEQP